MSGLNKSRVCVRCVRDVLEIINCTNCRTRFFLKKYVHEYNFSVSWVHKVILRKIRLQQSVRQIFKTMN